MPRERVAPEPALSEVVRQRLATLLDEIPARRAIQSADEPEEPTNGPPASGTEAASKDVAAARDALAGVLPRPGPVQWARSVWEFSRSHLIAVGIVLLTGCLWAGYNVLQARSTPVAAAEPAATASVTLPPSPTPSPARILVHVLGAVNRPGVVSLPEGARVQDAIVAAGGLTLQADPAELNLAAIVVDGSQLVIGDTGSPRGEVRAAGTTGGSGAAVVTLNTATQAELEMLPGVGPVTASRIIAWREQHGRFTSVEELQEVDGIGPKTYAQLVDHVRV